MKLNTWERNAEGERRVAVVLDRLPQEFVVFHDLPIPSSKANIDHLVVSAHGIWAVDAKYYSNPVTYGYGKGADTLWTARSPLKRTLAASSWEAATATELISQPVNSVVCMIAPSLPSNSFEFDGVRICSPSHLLGELSAARSDTATIDATVAVVAVERIFGVQPSARPAAPEKGDISRPAERPVTSSIAVVRTRQLASPDRRRLLGAAVGSPLVRLLFIGCAALVFLALLPTFTSLTSKAAQKGAERMMEDLTPTTVTRTETTPPTTVATTTVATTTAVSDIGPPLAVDYIVDCPVPGAGWVAAWVWPGSPPDGVAGYGIRTQETGGPVLQHTISTWSSPDSPPASIRVAADSEFIVITDYLSADSEVLGSTTEQFAQPSGEC